MCITLVLSFFCISFCLTAHEITLHNKTPYTLYGALYNQEMHHVSDAVLLPQQETAVLIVPSSNHYLESAYTSIVITTEVKRLRENLTEKDLKDMFCSFVSTQWGSTFYLVGNYVTTFRLYTRLEYILFYVNKLSVMVDELEYYFIMFKKMVFNFLKEHFKSDQDNPYDKTVASVRQGNGLCEEELEYLKVRTKRIRKALLSLEDSTDDLTPPRISLICSGGGYRSMLATVGWLLGAQDIGLLDMTTYITGLSGSTWTLGTWMSTGFSLQDLKHYFIDQLEKDITSFSATEFKLLSKMLLQKKLFGQPTTLVDVYGGLLANRLFGFFNEGRQHITLSHQKHLLQDGLYPLPIYTAISEEKPYSWYEFTPYEIGSHSYGHYIPSWSFGRKFQDGQSVDFAPEQSLGFEMGIFGSAFAAEIGHIFEKLLHKLSTYKVDFITPDKRRLTYGMVFNFMYGITGCLKEKDRFIKLIDAAFELNLAYPPVGGVRPERASDILIFLDSSNYSTGRKMFGYALCKAEEYARKHGLAFPPIDYSDLDNHAVSIFKDEQDSSVPVVIYLPLIKDDALWKTKKDTLEYSQYKDCLDDFDPQDCIKFAYCSTFNLRYTADQIKQLAAQTEFNMRASKETIMDAIRWKIST